MIVEQTNYYHPHHAHNVHLHNTSDPYSLLPSSSEESVEGGGGGDGSVEQLISRKGLLFNISLEICNAIFSQIMGSHASGGVVYIDMPESNSSGEEIDMDEHEYTEVFNYVTISLAGGLELVPWNIFLVFTLLYTAAILFGLISNATIVATFYNCKKLRTFRNAYIVNLAIRLVLLYFTFYYLYHIINNNIGNKYNNFDIVSKVLSFYRISKIIS